MEAQPARRRDRPRGLVVDLQGPGARPARAQGGHLQPERRGGRGRLPPGPGPGRSEPGPVFPGDQRRRLSHRGQARHGRRRYVRRLLDLDHLQCGGGGQLGHRRLGQGAPHRRGEPGQRPGLRRRHRQRDPVGPDRTGGRLLLAAGQRRPEGPARLDRGQLPEGLRPHQQPVQRRGRGPRRRHHGPDPAAERPGLGRRHRGAPPAARARHRHADRRAAGSADHRRGAAPDRRSGRAGQCGLDPAGAGWPPPATIRT